MATVQLSLRSDQGDEVRQAILLLRKVHILEKAGLVRRPSQGAWRGGFEERVGGGIGGRVVIG